MEFVTDPSLARNRFLSVSRCSSWLSSICVIFKCCMIDRCSRGSCEIIVGIFFGGVGVGGGGGWGVFSSSLMMGNLSRVDVSMQK